MKQGAHLGAMTAASRLRAVGGTVLKVAAWVVAVPALCLVVGAAPLYLLLPDDKPSATTATKPVLAGTALPTAADAKPPEAGPPTARADPNPKTESADLSTVGAVSPPADDSPAETEEATVALQEEATDSASPRPEAVAVIPTPRPAPPVPATADAAPPAVPATEAKSAEKPPVKLAAVEPPTRPEENTGDGRAVVQRKVTLRAGPWGRQIGTLDPGTSVAVGRCAEWCEVRAGNLRGWVHPSFLAGAAPAKRGNDVRTRAPERREAARRARDDSEEARALTRAREGQRYDDEAEPGWFIDDGPPVIVERRRAPSPRFDDELEGYLPY